MPKKPKIELRMTGYPPFSTCRWQLLAVAEVGSAGRGTVQFVLTPVDNPGQAGRRCHHDLPGVLAPGSPLAEFLRAALGVAIAAGQTIDLAKLAGRRVMAKFGEPRADGEQPIVAVKPYTESAAKPATPTAIPAVMPVASGSTVIGKPGGSK